METETLDTWIGVSYPQHGVRGPRPVIVRFREEHSDRFTSAFASPGEAKHACEAHFAHHARKGVHDQPGPVHWDKGDPEIPDDDATRWVGYYDNMGDPEEQFELYYVMLLTSLVIDGDRGSS